MMQRFLVKALLYLRVIISPVLLTLCSLLMLLVAIFTLFQQRRFYAERIAAPFGQLMLALWGIKLEVHGRPEQHQLAYSEPKQTVYISNHTSTLDIFALVALGLPNARFFLSGYLKKLLPLGLIGYLIGNFWTVPQEYPEQRTVIFKNAAKTLRKTGESVYLSPEGERVTSGKIGAFNKGAFHLATELGAPIVPLYIFIPPAIDPGVGLTPGSGAMHVYFGEAIDTSQWQVDDLVANKERVRDLFVAWRQDVTGQNQSNDAAHHS